MGASVCMPMGAKGEELEALARATEDDMREPALELQESLPDAAACSSEPSAAPLFPFGWGAPADAPGATSSPDSPLSVSSGASKAGSAEQMSPVSSEALVVIETLRTVLGSSAQLPAEGHPSAAAAHRIVAEGGEGKEEDDEVVPRPRPRLPVSIGAVASAGTRTPSPAPSGKAFGVALTSASGPSAGHSTANLRGTLAALEEIVRELKREHRGGLGEQFHVFPPYPCFGCFFFFSVSVSLASFSLSLPHFESLSMSLSFSQEKSKILESQASEVRALRHSVLSLSSSEVSDRHSSLPLFRPFHCAPVCFLLLCFLISCVPPYLFP